MPRLAGELSSAPGTPASPGSAELPCSSPRSSRSAPRAGRSPSDRLCSASPTSSPTCATSSSARGSTARPRSSPSPSRAFASRSWGGAVATGTLDGLLAGTFAAGPRGSGLDLAALTREVAPDVTPAVARRAVALFAFGQSLHYAVWLRLIPDDDRHGGGTRSWRGSWRALRRDVPVWLLGGAFAASVGLAAMAAVDLADARRRYFQLAFFHGYVELVALARRAAGEPR